MYVYRDLSAAGKTRDSFPLFDWLRFALASAVALTHEGAIPWENAGNFAVQVFFALSGWLIGGILLRTKLRDLPRFYYNRATRIWVPYVFAVAAIYLLSAMHEPATYFRVLFYDLTFTHNWFVNPTAPMPLHGTGAHFWSISVEEQFYLAAPLLLFLPRVGRSIPFWLVIAFSALATHSWYSSISLGVLCAVAREHWGDWQVSRAGTATCAFVAILAGSVMLLFPPSYEFSAPVAACSIVLLTSRTGARSKLGTFVGAVSYPLYLYHWTGAFVAHAISRAVPEALIAYPVAVAAGAGAYMAIDRNVMRRRTAAYLPKYGRAVTATAYALLAAGVVGGLASG